MYPTVEVRWFFRGQIPPPVATWFAQYRPEPEPERVDYYLRLQDDHTTSIKLRQGSVEVKKRQHLLDVVHLPHQAISQMDHWRKWSYPLAGPVETPAPFYVAVTKRRQMRKYRVNLGTEHITGVPLAEQIALGCEVELTQVEAQGQQWWTIGFEAFGPEARLQETLLFAAGHILRAHPPPLPLRATDSYSYPQWLSHLRQY